MPSNTQAAIILGGLKVLSDRVRSDSSGGASSTYKITSVKELSRESLGSALSWREQSYEGDKLTISVTNNSKSYELSVNIFYIIYRKDRPLERDLIPYQWKGPINLTAGETKSVTIDRVSTSHAPYHIFFS